MCNFRTKLKQMNHLEAGTHQNVTIMHVTAVKQLLITPSIEFCWKIHSKIQFNF